MAKIKDVASDLFNIFKGLGLNKEATGSQQEFSLDKFTGKMQERNSLARANRYVVRMSVPQWAAGVDAQAAQEIMFFCDSVNFPGASIVPVDIKRQGIGPFDRRPSNIIPEEVTLSIMLDGAGYNLNFFHKWINSIVNMDMSAGELGTRDGALPGEVHYRDFYKVDIEIEIYDTAARMINKVKMFECWPSQISPVSLGWAQNDEYARVQVNMQQRAFTIEDQGPAQGSDERQLSAFEQLLRIGQAAKALKSSWKTPNNVGDVINVVSNGQTFLKTLAGKGP